MLEKDVVIDILFYFHKFIFIKNIYFKQAIIRALRFLY